MAKEKEKNVSKKKKGSKEKKSLWAKFRTFLSGVKAESKKVHWTTKNDMVKYSIATVIFIVFCSLFFYGIEVAFALLQTLLK